MFKANGIAISTNNCSPLLLGTEVGHEKQSVCESCGTDGRRQVRPGRLGYAPMGEN